MYGSSREVNPRDAGNDSGRGTSQSSHQNVAHFFPGGHVGYTGDSSSSRQPQADNASTIPWEHRSDGRLWRQRWMLMSNGQWDWGWESQSAPTAPTALAQPTSDQVLGQTTSSGSASVRLRQTLNRDNEALSAPSPRYEERFPHAPGLFGQYITGTQVHLSKVHLENTMDFVNRAPDTKNTFNELSNRENTVRYWIESHESAFKGMTSTMIGYYKEVCRRIDEESSSVKMLINAESAARRYRIGLSRDELASAIQGYKTAFNDLLDVANELYKVIYPQPAPPAYPGSSG